MLTDDEKRGLIETALRLALRFDLGYGPDTARQVARVLTPRLARRLADALEGTLTEPEWEWAVRQGDGVVWGVDLDDEPWTEQTAYLDRDSIKGGQVVRRRKAGPWEVVTDDRD